jgi:hypothetical protein
MNSASSDCFKHPSKAAARGAKLITPNIHARQYLVLVRKL